MSKFNRELREPKSLLCKKCGGAGTRTLVSQEGTPFIVTCGFCGGTGRG
jgi:DnaJ-class molecular chaperone